MQRINRRAACLALGILSSMVLIRAQAQPLPVVQRLDSFFSAPGNYETINGNILIAVDGRVIYQRSSGFASFERKISTRENSSFNIASITKTFTATAILQLAEKGKLRLDDPLVNYFPDFPYPGIRLRNLLSHTSGLPDLEIFFEPAKKDPDKIITNAGIIPALKGYNKPLKFQPGDDWDYCNTNFELLALLVEKISRLSFPAYLKKFIFLPAGMQHTYVQEGIGKLPDSNQATAYLPDKYYQSAYTPADSVPGLRIHQILYNFSGLQGAGMIISTVGDLLNYDNALYSGRLLSPLSLNEAFTPTRLNKGKDYDASPNKRLGKAYYGLGWEIYADTSMGRIVSHGGSYPGIVSIFLRNISKRQTVILYDNTSWTGIFFMGNMALEIVNNRAVNDILPKKSLARVYGQALMEKGPDAASDTMISLRTDTVHYVIREREMNTLGYQFLQDGYLAKAEEAFKMNSLLFPASFNVYDSYADALARSGKKTDAMLMYKKSIALNPGYQEARDKLRELERLK